MRAPKELVATMLAVHWPSEADATRIGEVCDRLPASNGKLTDIPLIVMGEPTSWAYEEGRHNYLGGIQEFIAYRFTTVKDCDGWENYYKHFMRFSKQSPPYWTPSQKVVTLWVSSDHEELGRSENLAFYDRDIILDVYRLSRD